MCKYSTNAGDGFIRLPSETGIDIILRYYSKQTTYKTNFSNYFQDNIIHIPYGALIWFGNITSTEQGGVGYFTVKSEIPLHGNNVINNARLKFDYFIKNNAIYANDYFADLVGIYKVPNDNYINNDENITYDVDTPLISGSSIPIATDEKYH